MSKKQGIVILLISILAIGLSIAALVAWIGFRPQTGAADEDVQYVLYLGTNDKDTNEPVFPPEEAKSRAEEILLGSFGGYTIQEANGGWIDEGLVYREYTLVIYLSDTTLEQVHEAADILIREFNQSSVLIQANRTRTEFYAG
ncbi:MAG: hypothetical protein IIZ49_05335 [Oscillospiraceae bacterium]|nr:hypothetical protein [Oscillospiraceae bacterium]